MTNRSAHDEEETSDAGWPWNKIRKSTAMSDHRLDYHVVFAALLLLMFVPVNQAWSSPLKRSSRASINLPRSTLREAVLMPDGGVSPCVIRVLGVGGGGCNAVRSSRAHHA